jgi:hypothetical protein
VSAGRIAAIVVLVSAALTATPASAQVGATPRIGPTTPSGSALDRIYNQSTRPMPAAPTPMGQSPADVWVPDRIIPVPGQLGGAMVPGHWERRISDRENYVPPLVITTPDGRTTTVPGGVAPPPEQRQSP